MRSLGCRRFGRLLSEIADREPTPRETAFLERHRASCDACSREEEASFLTLDLLRGCAFDAQIEEPAFDRRVLRRARITMVRDGVRYWSPALIGGAVAAGLFLAAVQAVTRPVIPGSTPGMEAKRKRGDDPSLALREENIKFTDARLSPAPTAGP